MSRRQGLQPKASTSKPKRGSRLRVSLGLDKPSKQKQTKIGNRPRANQRISAKVRAFTMPTRSWRTFFSSPKFRRFLTMGGRIAIVMGCAYGLLLAAQSAYAYATTSPRFAARILEVKPTPHMPVELLRERLAIPEGTNIWSLDMEQLKTRIEADPWIANAELTRHLPDTLRVHLNEHEAAAILLAERLYFVNPQGVPFKALTAEDSKDLPMITGLPPQPLLQPSPETEAIIERGLAVLAAYQTKQRPKLSEIHVGVGGEIILYTAKVGTVLRLGRGSIETLRERLTYFDALRAALGDKSENVAVVHLDVNPTANKHQRLFVRFFSQTDAAHMLAMDAASKSSS